MATNKVVLGIFTVTVHTEVRLSEFSGQFSLALNLNQKIVNGSIGQEFKYLPPVMLL